MLHVPRVLVVGCGSMAREWLRALLSASDVVVAGLADLDSAAADRLAVEFALDCPVYDDVTAALAGADADVVVDVTVPAAHRGVTLAALEAGAHVLGEKPMATSLADARVMVAA